MTTLSITQVATIKTIVDDLAVLGIAPLHLRVDTLTVGDPRPSINLWAQTRTDFELLCDRWSLKPVERRFSPSTQREWYAERDLDDRLMLVQVVSFAHHADWQPREVVES